MNIFIILIIFIIFLIFIIVRDYQIKKKKFKLNNALNSNFFIQTINNLIEENKYNLLEELYGDLCCSDADYGDITYYDIVENNLKNING